MAHYKCKECHGDMTTGEMVDYGTLCTDCFHDYKEHLEPNNPIREVVESVIDKVSKTRLDK